MSNGEQSPIDKLADQSDTPRTDAAWKEWQDAMTSTEPTPDPTTPLPDVWALARQLERELAERTEEYEETRELLGKELERKARWMKLADERAIEVADLKVQLARPSAASTSELPTTEKIDHVIEVLEQIAKKPEDKFSHRYFAGHAAILLKQLSGVSSERRPDAPSFEAIMGEGESWRDEMRASPSHAAASVPLAEALEIARKYADTPFHPDDWAHYNHTTKLSYALLLSGVSHELPPYPPVYHTQRTGARDEAPKPMVMQEHYDELRALIAGSATRRSDG
jgi:hypothetical protein